MGDVYKTPSTRLSSEFDDKVTEREESRMISRFLPWSPKWLLMSAEREGTGEKDRLGVGVRAGVSDRRYRTCEAEGKNC